MRSGGLFKFVTFGLSVMFAVTFLTVLTACQGGLEKGLAGPVPASPDELIAELEAEKERIDKRTDMMMDRIEAYNASRAPGDREVHFSELFYSDLDPEQRDVLDALLQEEKRPSYRNLLTRIIEDRKNIEQMQSRIQYLEQRLPDDFAIVKKGDNHYDLAIAYLEREGVDKDHAKELVGQISLMQDLVAGFKVWFNYDEENDKFKTYVTRGEAGQTPLAVARAIRRNLITERDIALARATALEETKNALEEDISKLQGDLMKLEDRRSELTVTVADLEARNNDLTEQEKKLSEDLAYAKNTLSYHAASRKTLAQQGILTRFLKNLKDVKNVDFDQTLDLRESQSISLSAEPFGLKTIRKVEIWPDVYKEGRDYSVRIENGGRTATVVLNDPNMFKRQRLLISVNGKS
ncbi:MAG: hypothetical protein ACE5HU_05895 [Acidobacteriota bacterium]